MHPGRDEDHPSFLNGLLLIVSPRVIPFCSPSVSLTRSLKTRRGVSDGEEGNITAPYCCAERRMLHIARPLRIQLQRGEEGVEVSGCVRKAVREEHVVVHEGHFDGEGEGVEPAAAAVVVNS